MLPWCDHRDLNDVTDTSSLNSVKLAMLASCSENRLPRSHFVFSPAARWRREWWWSLLQWYTPTVSSFQKYTWLKALIKPGYLGKTNLIPQLCKDPKKEWGWVTRRLLIGWEILQSRFQLDRVIVIGIEITIRKSDQNLRGLVAFVNVELIEHFQLYWMSALKIWTTICAAVTGERISSRHICRSLIAPPVTDDWHTVKIIPLDDWRHCLEK